MSGSSAWNAIQASAWVWQSYDKVCRATNTIDVSGGGLVSSGLPRRMLRPARPVTESHDTPEFPELIKTPVLG